MMTSLLKLPYSVIRPLYEKTNFHKAVIAEIEDARLRLAYSHCRAITRRHAKTFYMATRFLPHHKQRSIFAIYGLCRYLDDLVDESEDLIAKKKISQLEIIERLETFKEELINAYKGGIQSKSVLIAFSDVLKTYDISLELPLLLFDGVKTDLIKDRYDTFQELYDYSYKVASVVGLMTSEVFGYSDPKALDHAVELGIAMQLTNILRDVGEDLDKDRIYIPREDLDRFNISEADLNTRDVTEPFSEMMRFQIQRARDFYNRSEVGIDMLNKDSRLPVLLAKENYGRILNKIEENRYHVFDRRAFLSTTEKFAILPRVMLQLRG